MKEKVHEQSTHSSEEPEEAYLGEEGGHFETLL
jgi:hypothetical protein